MVAVSSPHRRPPRLGVHVTDEGVEAAVLAPHAEAVELCLLDESGAEQRRIRLDGPDLGVFSAVVPSSHV